MKQRPILLGILLSGVALLLGVLVLWNVRREPPPSAATQQRPPVEAAVEPSKEEAPAAEVKETVLEEIAPATSGTIRGRVFLDAPPAPAPGASVAATLDLARSYAKVVTAGPDGAYDLEGLAPGRYRVIAWSGDWAMEPLDPEEDLVAVRAGRTTDSVDRTLIPGGVVAGKVIEEGTKEPIAGATVEIAGARFALTGEAGEFQLEGVRPGCHYVSANAKGFTSRRALVEVTAGGRPFVVLELTPGGVIEGLVTDPAGQPAPGATAWTTVNRAWIKTAADAEGRYALEGVPLEARDITVFAAREGQFETREGVKGFPEGEASIHLDLRLEAGITFAGRVVDLQGRPIPGVALHIASSGDKPAAVTCDEGLFTIEGATAATGFLTALKKGCAPASQDLQDFKSRDERLAIELVLEPGHFVEGKVVDASGHPVHRAWVGIDLVGNYEGPYPWCFTGRDGSFRLEDLPVEFGGLAAAKPGYGESRGNQVEADRTGVVLVLQEALIEGIVVEKATGKPIPEFTVTFGSTELQARGGRFKISADIGQNESYEIIVVAEGYAEAFAGKVKAWPASEAREPLRFELERGGALHGRVVSAATRAPLEGVRVAHVTERRESPGNQWFDCGWRSPSDGVLRKATTGATGELTILGLSDRPGVLLLDRKGFARTVISGVRASGAVQTFALAPGAAVDGTARDAGGGPFSNIRVRAFAGGQLFPGTSTGPDGKYRLEDLPEGDTTVTFEMPASAGEAIRRQVSVRLKSGQTAVADLVVATGSISGTLTRRGVPLRQAHVLVSGHPGESEWFWTDGKGRFQAVALPPGPYEVRIESVREGDAFRSVGLARKVEVGGGETRCDIDLAATHVSGRVVRGETGEPVWGAHVALLNADGWTMAEATCAPAGDRFELEAPGTGTYWLAVSAAKGGKAGGWLGPLAIEEGIGLQGLDLPMGGAATVSVLVLDAAAREPLAGATVLLRDAGGIAFQAGSTTDAGGRAELSEVPRGTYRLEAETEEHLPRAVDLEVGSAAAEWTFELERASWIVVELEGGRGAAEGVCVEATVLDGGDPGWLGRSGGEAGSRQRSFKCSSPQSPSPSQVSFKARAGRYRIRFIAMAPRSNSLSDPRNTVEEVDVAVPEAGEARVLLKSTER